MAAFLRKFRTSSAPVVEEPVREDDRESSSTSHEQKTENGNESEGVSLDVQAGIKKIEATTTVWTTSNLVLAYVL